MPVLQLLAWIKHERNIMTSDEIKYTMPEIEQAEALVSNFASGFKRNVPNAITGITARIRAVTRLLADSGDITSAGVLQIEAVLRDEERKHDDKQ
jgi:hypothetical protein